MTPNERTILLELIDGHHAAMRAQVDDPGVPVEHRGRLGLWEKCLPGHKLFDGEGTPERLWHRLAPAPRMIDLDQSDFLGPNRVTHLRPMQSSIIADATNIYAVVWSCATMVSIGGGASMTYRTLREGWERSRDFGATWQKCEKASV